MSKAGCGTVRDLIPLVIDGVASEDSRCLVQQHMEECQACAQVYADMQDELARAMAEREQAEMKAAMARARRRLRIRRAIGLGLAGLLAAALIVLLCIHWEEIIFRARYVHLSGDLRREALFARVSGFPDDPVRYIHLTSSPSGSPDFQWKFEGEMLPDGESWCLQVRAEYMGWDLEDYEAGGVICYGHNQDGVWVGYSGAETGYLPIVRVELLCGDTATVLWELGDEVPTQWEVSEEEQLLRESLQGEQP